MAPPPTVRAEEPPPACNGRRATIVAGSGIRITGTPRRDVIVGGSERDIIDGRGGPDVICGKQSNDVIRGGSGRDVLIGGAGYDVLKGNSGDDTLRGGHRRDVLNGGPGSDRILGQKHADTLFPGPGRDSVDGGPGRNVVSYATSRRGVDIDLRKSRATGEGRDSLTRIYAAIGSLHRDVIRGTNGRDLLSGLGGRDRIFGRAGRDLLAGDGGRDRLHGGRGTDLVTYVFARNGVLVTLAGYKDRLRSIEGLQGSTYDDELTGRSRADLIDGLAGDDRLMGQAGDDTLKGRHGDDTFVGGRGDDSLHGGDGVDVLDHRATGRGIEVDFSLGTVVGDGIDRIFLIESVLGSRFSDRIWGSGGNEAVVGGDGDDEIALAGGADYARGGAGSDRIDGGSGVRDELQGGDGNDWLNGGDGFDELHGESGNDTILGGSARDEIYGAWGDDSIDGGLGDDSIEPGRGDDHVNGGEGADFVGFAEASEPMRVDLAAGSAVGDGTDVLVAIEKVGGSQLDDVLIGDDGPNTLAGEYGGGTYGDDQIYGRGGDDQLFLDGGDGDQLADGGAGIDLCSEADTMVSCELPKPHPPVGRVTQPRSDEYNPGPRPSFAPNDGSAPQEAVASASTGFQVDAAHTGHVAGTGLTPPLKQRWTRTFEGQVSYPVIAKGMLFITEGATSMDDADVSTLHALDAESGAELWRRETAAESGVSYENDRLLWVDRSGFVAALEPGSGALLWQSQLPFGRGVAAPPVAADDDLYLKPGGGRGGVYALDAVTGRVEWMRETRYGSSDGGPAVSSDRIFVALPSPKIYAYDRVTGDAPWLFSGCCSGGGGSTAVYYEGRVYAHDIGISTGYVLDASTGEEVGIFDSDTVPAIAESTAVWLEDRAMHAWDVYGGGHRWTFDPEEYLQSAPLIVDEHVYVGSAQGSLYAIDLQTGAEVWSTALPDGVNVPESFFTASAAGIGAAPGLLVVPAQRTLTAFGPE